MNKRSYLDTLNDGRQRKSHTTLEQLNRSLEMLEQRLERSREETVEARYPATQPHMPRPQDDMRFAPYDQPRSRPLRDQDPAFDHTYQAIARDIDRVRSQEDGVATVSRIAGELRGLREELRHQMTAGLQREFDSLRADIERALNSDAPVPDSAQLGLEFERLSGAIQTLAEKSDDRSVNLLRLELEQVKAALDTLAREESVQAVGRRWDDFDRRWSAFEDRVEADSQKKAEIPELAALTERLEQINNAVNNLPESLSLRSLEEKVRTLAGAVDHFANQQGGRGAETLRLIDERLDEISRAIVASTVAAQANAFDPAAFERIERRIDSLAGQIEEVSGGQPSAEVMDRLNTLSRRVDELATRADFPEQAVERLGQQIALIADKIERAPAIGADALFQGLEQRFDLLAGMLERRQGDAL
jgi:localization factor PodJL